MPYGQAISDVISQRFSCRNYCKSPIEKDLVRDLEEYIRSLGPGPFGSRVRFKLIAAQAEDKAPLQGAGTYGWIKNPAGFIICALRDTDKSLEDLGYLMEKIVLFATAGGLASCWLGGTFSKNGFGRKISAAADEYVPVVASIGYLKKRSELGRTHRKRRKPPAEMFFNGQFGKSLDMAEAGAFRLPLEMVRLAPSAANKQPWRILRDRGAWHFYLQRTPGYGSGLLARLLKFADLQRIDMGIAMSHFAVTAGELALQGRWQASEPDIAKPDSHTEYTVSWLEE